MNSLQGQLLIATPQLLDPNFFHTVVLIVQHNEEGALGLVLNRPTETLIDEVWKQIDKENDNPCNIEGFIFEGGPCPGPLMVIHDNPQCSDMRVFNGIHFTTESHQIHSLVSETSNLIKCFVNYSGWTAGQLEAELEDGGWILAPATPSSIFGDPEELWTTAFRDASFNNLFPHINPKTIPNDPSLN